MTVLWVVLAGQPSYLRLMHRTQDSSPSVLKDNIPPDSLHVTVWKDFDLGKDNTFEMLAFEPGGEEPSGGDDGGAIQIPAENGTVVVDSRKSVNMS